MQSLSSSSTSSSPLLAFPFDPWDRSIDFDSSLSQVKEYVSKCDLENWYGVLKDHTFASEWFVLEEHQIRALRARFAKETTKEDERVLSALADTVHKILVLKFKEQGAFVRLSTRSPKDAIVSSAVFVQWMREKLSGIAADDFLEAGLAFYECVMDAGRMTNGQAAVDLLCNSSRVFLDLKRAMDAKFAVNCVIREYRLLPPCSEFRVFVVQGKITAVSQYIDCLFFPQLNVEQLRSVLLDFQEAVFKKHAAELPIAFVADMSVENDRCTIIELNPFIHKTGAALFDWNADKEILLNGDCVIRLTSEQDALKKAKREFQGIREEMEEAAKRNQMAGNDQKCSLQ